MAQDVELRINNGKADTLAGREFGTEAACSAYVDKTDSTGSSGARLSETHNRDDTFVMNSTDKLEMQYNKL